MLTRSIDIDDPFALTVEEKIFLNAKRLCFIFAGAALTLSALDLMNVRSVENAAEYVHDHRSQLGAVVQVVRAGFSHFSFKPQPPTSVTVAIPPDDIAMAQRAPAIRASLNTDIAPVNELAAARHQDAVEMAMVAPPAMPQLTQPPAHEPAAAPPALSATAPIQLASINPSDLPQAAPLAPSVTLPATISVLPIPAPPLSPAQRLHLEGPARAKAERCLSNAIYFEARDQPYKGQVAVAQVVINRVFSGIYPRDVCGVIYQNASHHLACQFTFACDGKRKVINERAAGARARRIAQQTLDGKLYVPAVGTATHYHAIYVRPNWVREMHRLVREGTHAFYRPIAWGSGADMPIWSRAELATNSRKR